MTTPATPTNKPAKNVKARIPAKIRQAIDLYTTERISKTEAAKRLDIKPSYLYTQLTKVHIRDYERERFAQYIQDIEDLKAPYKAEAIETAAELMRSAKSESVRARMVEFLAGERKDSSVKVAVQVNNQPAQGYEYARASQEALATLPASEVSEHSAQSNSDDDAS